MVIDNPEKRDNFWNDADIVSKYSRADAIKDGTLADVTEQAKDCGFTVPVAITDTVHNTIEQAVRNDSTNDYAGILHDILTMAFYTVRRAPRGITAALMTVAIRGLSARKNIQLKIMIGPGDNAEPVITISFPEEN